MLSLLFFSSEASAFTSLQGVRLEAGYQTLYTKNQDSYPTEEQYNLDQSCRMGYYIDEIVMRGQSETTYHDTYYPSSGPPFSYKECVYSFAGGEGTAYCSRRLWDGTKFVTECKTCPLSKPWVNWTECYDRRYNDIELRAGSRRREYRYTQSCPDPNKVLFSLGWFYSWFYEQCGWGLPNYSDYRIEDFQNAYTFKLVCEAGSRPVSLLVETTSFSMSSSSSYPSEKDFLINGVSPTNTDIAAVRTEFSDGCMTEYWMGGTKLRWLIPITARCGKTVTLTPSLPAGTTGRATISLVKAISEKILKYVSGNGQEGDILTSLENPFVVKVVDENNNPTTGNVTWQVTSVPQDAQGLSLSTTTGLSTTFTLGDTLGDYTVTATCTDCKEDNKTVTFVAKASGPKISLTLTPESVRPLETGGNNVTIATATVTSKSRKEYEVQFEAEGVFPSGGHDASHSGNRPVGTFSTNACMTIQGKCDVNYTASRFGGVDRITAKLINYPKIKDTRNITLAVDNLTLLPADDNYEKIGGTARHHGPPVSQEDHNHYGTNYTITAIMNIADLYRREFQQRLRINDISLPNGGGFDNGGNWEADIIDTNPTRRGCQNPVGHCTHRIGRNVDVDDRTAGGGNVAERWLREIVENDFGGGFLNETTHYHMTF